MKYVGITLGCVGIGLVCFWFYNIVDSLMGANELEEMMRGYEKWST